LSPQSLESDRIVLSKFKKSVKALHGAGLGKKQEYTLKLKLGYLWWRLHRNPNQQLKDVILV
jgi:hypothetical protein